MTDSTPVMNEGFVLARRGLPLAGNVPSQPRAAWLPAPARSPVVPVPPRRQVVPAAAGEDDAAQEEGADAWDLSPPSAPATAARDTSTPAAGPASAGPAGQGTAAAATPARAATASAGVDAAASRAGAAGPAHLPMQALPHRHPGEDSPAGVPAESRPLAMPVPLASQPDAIATPTPFPRSFDAPAARPHPDPALAGTDPPPSGAAPAQAASGQGRATDTRGDPGLRRLASVTVIPAQQHREPVSLRPANVGVPAGSLAIFALSETRVAADPAGNLPAEPSRLLMGLPVAQPIAAAHSLNAPTARPEIDVLLAPAPAPQRSVFIDRVSVTVQAPALPAPPAPQPAPAATRNAPAAAPGTFRNPWASYHARRD
jgi:hypothetical protein